MKKISWILVVLLFVASVVLAGKMSDYSDLSAGNIADGDMFLLRDVSDTTLGSTGTQKEYSWAAMKADLFSAGFMKDLVDDTSPQLGGNLDSNNFNVYIGDGTYSWDHSPILGCEGVVEIDGTLYADGGIQTGASAQPGVTGDDSDTTASPDWKIYGDATDTTAGSEDVDLFIQTLVDGSMTTLLQFDADGNIEVAKDINLASGKKYKINGSQISSDDLSDSTTINTNLLEFINKDLTTLHSGKDEWVYIPTTCSWTSVHVGYDGTVTDLVFTVYSADSPYGTATTVGTIDPDNSPSVSGWGNITAGKWVKMEVTTASTGDATACQVAFVLTNQ